MLISGATRLAAVIGWPVRHSLSPAIHNAAFAAAGLDWAYVALEVRSERGADAVAAMRTLGIEGLSVTMPHKAAVAGAVDARTDAAEVLGAVNCVFRDGDRLVGDNTDGEGFVDGLRLDHGVDPAGRRCLVVGAGGAARAVVRALAASGATEVAVLNRTRSRAEEAARLAGGAGRVADPADVAGADLVVDATPMGMTGQGGGPDDGSPEWASSLHAGQVVADLVVDPVRTPLLGVAAARGATTVDGLSMLVHQAAHAFRRWTGVEPPLDAMRAAVEPARASPPDS